MEHKKKKYHLRKKFTGEDFEMLFEREREPEAYESGSLKYKDDIDSV